MNKILRFLACVLLISCSSYMEIASANFQFTNSQTTNIQAEQNSDISYYELDMFKSIAENGELTENELRGIVKTLKQVGLVTHEWHIKSNPAGGTSVNQYNNYSDNSYVYKRTNKELGYRRFGLIPATGKIGNLLEDIECDVYIRVSSETKLVEKITARIYSYFGGIYFPDYTYTAAQKYSRTLVLYENGKLYASLDDLQISKDYAQNALIYVFEDIEKQYPGQWKLSSAEYNPIFNGNSEIFTEVFVQGDVIKQVYGYPEGKAIKSFSNIYIFDKAGNVVDSAKKSEDIRY